jgi:hypothetical protein
LHWNPALLHTDYQEENMRRVLVIAVFVLITQMGFSQSATRHDGHQLNDAALNQITAGSVSATVNGGVVNFGGAVQTPNGLVSAAGNLAMLNGPLAGANAGSITLNGAAQQDLTSLVNINAANSIVNVLLNLNVNINSTVGNLVQSNLAGKH